MREVNKVRKWSLKWGGKTEIDVYQVTQAIEFLLRSFPDATEEEVEQVARRHGYEVQWE